MLREKIKLEIKDKIQDADIKIFTNDDKYFNAVVISDIFIDKTLIDRQSIIHEIIGKYIINKQIHAISFKTYTKHEWSEENKE